MSMLKSLPLLLAGAAAVIAMLPATASAGNVDLARAECRHERATEPAEFAVEYGGTGKAALKRCVRREIRKARVECRTERRTEPREFRREYGGTGKRALRRCVRDELR